MRWWIAIVLTVLLLLPAVANADQAVVQLRDGSTLRGDIQRYEVGEGLTIRLSTGQDLSFRASDVAEVRVIPADPPAAPVEQPPPPPKPGIVGPFVFLMTGAVALVTGGLLFQSDCYGCENRNPIGLGLMIPGAILTFLSLALYLPLRVGKQRRWRRRYGDIEIAAILGPRVGLAGRLRF